MMRPIPPLFVIVVAGLLSILAAPAGPSAASSRSGDVVADLEADTALLVAEVKRLTRLTTELRDELARVELEAADATRELEELRRFIDDHRELGDDFARYQAVRAVAERDARLRAAEAARERKETERVQRLARMEEARARRAVAQSEESHVSRYRDAGFGSLGLDVWMGRAAYSYPVKDSTTARVEYDPIIGLYYRPGPASEVDYGRMTISGSVVNAAEEVRNIGIAVTFFDESGNQVGGEIVQINNARPDVPYPFTSTIEMALDRPFSSSTSYVLYADVVP